MVIVVFGVRHVINVVVVWFARGKIMFGDVVARHHCFCETILMGVLPTYAQPALQGNPEIVINTQYVTNSTVIKSSN